MGSIRHPEPVLGVVAAFSRRGDALDWFARKAVETWGDVALASERFDFVETDYYQATMGDGLKKQFWAFERLVDPGDLPERKRTTNEWETLYAESHRGEEPRPLNLDPGYITLGKLVLASTKDHCHRLYLGDGIYGEATLHYRDRAWRSSDWTYPDYRREDFQAFFSRCRQWLKLRLRDSTHRAT